MNTQAKIIIGVLVAAVVGLGVTVGVMAARDDDHGATSANHMGNDSGFIGMMGAMGSIDSGDMLKHMREVLGEEGYQRMVAHLEDHRNGTPTTGNTAIDQMMHTMMDGMMQNMPMSGSTVLPPGDDQHHGSPVAATTPTP